MSKVTLDSIAKELNISKVAVHKALNDKPGISAELRAKVKETAKQLGYRPCISHYKTGLHFIYAIKKSFFLFAGEQFYTTIYYFLNAECERIDSTLNLLFYEDDDLVSTLNKKLASYKPSIAGVFIAGEVGKLSLQQLRELRIPFVFIDFFSPLYPYSYVYLDNYTASYTATQYLIDRGHRKIGFVGDITTTSSIKDRYFGYLKALSDNGIPARNDHLVCNNIEKMSTYEDILPADLPTAFLCHCDSAAHKLYLLLKFKNISIPGDVSVLSFDNTDLCKTIVPQLTSIGVPKEKYAKKSLELMLEQLEKPHAGCAALKPYLCERESVAPPPAAKE